MSVNLEIVSCVDCPNMGKERFYTADSWEYVSKWFCKKTDRPKSGTTDRMPRVENSSDIAYVEWVRDEPKEIPKWCPLRNQTI